MTRSRRIRFVLSPLILLAATGALIAQQHGMVSRALSSTPQPFHAPAHSGPTQVGVTTLALALNSYRPWRPSDLSQVNLFENQARKHASVVMFYADWAHAHPSLSQLQAIAARGSVPEVTWEPWNSFDKLHQPQPRFRLINIIDGSFDNYIRSWAKTFARFNRPVLLRFAQEMDGTWYPWSELSNGNHVGEFVTAWRHIHQLFAQAGATKVRWVWSPAFGAPAHYFPGRGEVDVLGITCLNGGNLWGGHWRSFVEICSKPIRALHQRAPRLPIQISEAGSTTHGGNKTAWIKAMFAYLDGHPEVGTLIYFNIDKETDWRISSPKASQRAFETGVNSGLFR